MYGSAGGEPVFLTPPRVELVSEPRDSPGLRMEDACEPGFLQEFTPASLLLPAPIGAAPLRAAFHGTSQAKHQYYSRVRDSGFYTFLPLAHVKYVNPVFFIGKDSVGSRIAW